MQRTAPCDPTSPQPAQSGPDLSFSPVVVSLRRCADATQQADKYLDDSVKRVSTSLDANDFLYAVSASRNYNPSPQLNLITAPLTFINSADDFINPPELGIAEREIRKVKNGRFILLPISDRTHGHGTHTDVAVWQQYLQQLLEGSQR